MKVVEIEDFTIFLIYKLFVRVLHFGNLNKCTGNTAFRKLLIFEKVNIGSQKVKETNQTSKIQL